MAAGAVVVVVEEASAVAGVSEVAGASEVAEASEEVVEEGSTAEINLTKGARVKRPLRGV